MAEQAKYALHDEFVSFREDVRAQFDSQSRLFDRLSDEMRRGFGAIAERESEHRRFPWAAVAVLVAAIGLAASFITHQIGVEKENTRDAIGQLRVNLQDHLGSEGHAETLQRHAATSAVLAALAEDIRDLGIFTRANIADRFTRTQFTQEALPRFESLDSRLRALEKGASRE